MGSVTQDEMPLSVCTRVRGSEPESVCVGEDFPLECRHTYKEGLSLYVCVWRWKHTPSLPELDIPQESKTQ